MLTDPLRGAPATAPQRTVSTLFPRLALRHLAAFGVAEQDVLDAAGVDGASLEAPDARIAGTKNDAIWHHATRLTGDPAYALRVGTMVDPAQLGPLAALAFAAPSLSVATDYLVRFIQLVGRAEFVVVRSDQQLSLVSQPLSYEEAGPREGPYVQGQEVAAVLFRRLVEHIVGRADWSLRIDFPRPAPDCLADYRDILQCRLGFDSPHFALSVALAQSEVRSTYADPDFCALISRNLDARMRALRSGSSTADRVRAELERAADLSGVSAQTLAETLQISPRTLFRRLRVEQQSFQSLLDEVRRKRCQELLAEQRPGAGELCEALGFSEPSNFYRAFKRWTGRSFSARDVS